MRFFTGHSGRGAIALAALVLSACASTYRSPELPANASESSIAILEPEVFQTNPRFFITKIDDRFRGVGWFERFELPPGRRSVTAAVNSANLIGNDITRYFTAEAGKKYLFVVHDDPGAKRWNFSIVEKDSRTRVDSSSQ